MSNSPIQEEASPLTDSGVDPITRVASGSSPLVLPWPPARTPVRAGREGRGPAQCGALKIIKFRGDLTNHAIAVRDLDRVPSVGNNRDGPSARPPCRAVRHKMRSVQWDCDWVRNRRRPGWRGLLLPPAASGPASTSPFNSRNRSRRCPGPGGVRSRDHLDGWVLLLPPGLRSQFS